MGVGCEWSIPKYMMSARFFKKCKFSEWGCAIIFFAASGAVGGVGRSKTGTDGAQTAQTQPPASDNARPRRAHPRRH
jgi:hypothetical protein